MTLFTSPLEQFEIHPLFFSLSFGSKILALTNETVFLFLVFIFLTLRLSFTFYEQRIVPLRWQSVAEEVLFFVKDLVTSNIGPKYVCYFPLIFMVFSFVRFSNLVGMVPFSFTVTSHIMITFGLALSLFIGINIVGVRQHGIVFLEFFMPGGAPLAAAPFFVLIELISYFARVFSLSIRLFANLISGHALLHILAGFSWQMLGSGVILALVSALPFAVIVAVTILELRIALLQAYVFAILTCLYLHDAIALSH